MKKQNGNSFGSRYKEFSKEYKKLGNKYDNGKLKSNECSKEIGNLLKYNQEMIAGDCAAKDTLEIMQQPLSPLAYQASEMLAFRGRYKVEVAEFSAKTLNYILENEGMKGNEDIINRLVSRISEGGEKGLIAYNDIEKLLSEKRISRYLKLNIRTYFCVMGDFKTEALAHFVKLIQCKDPEYRLDAQHQYQVDIFKEKLKRALKDNANRNKK